MALKIGALVPQSGIADRYTRWNEAMAFAKRAEELGFDSLWLIDHMLLRPGRRAAERGEAYNPELDARPPIGVWDCWSWLPGLAAVTSKVQLGQVVTCTGYRNPAMLAKMADTVDEMSGGRLILGIGAGDREDEHRSFGFPFEGRVGRFEEALQIICPLLREGKVDFVGEHYTARECELHPRGPSKNGPPILIGSNSGRPRMLRLMTQYADMTNAWFSFTESSPSRIPPIRDAVDAACIKHGRDPQTLERTATVAVVAPGRKMPYPDAIPLSGTPEEIAESLKAFEREGITHIQIWFAPMRVETLEWFAPALELARA